MKAGGYVVVSIPDPASTPFAAHVHIVLAFGCLRIVDELPELGVEPSVQRHFPRECPRYSIGRVVKRQPRLRGRQQDVVRQRKYPRASAPQAEALELLEAVILVCAQVARDKIARAAASHRVVLSDSEWSVPW